MIRKNVTRRDAEKVLHALKVQTGMLLAEAEGWPQPVIMEDWDWLGDGGTKWSIVWEEGPYEWAIRFPEGGIDEEASIEAAEFGVTAVRTRPVALPAHVWTEPITSWAIAILPRNW